MSVKIREYKKGDLTTYFVEPSSLDSATRTLEIPNLIYFHGVINQHLQKKENKETFIKDPLSLPFMNKIVSLIEETPFTVAIPLCFDYQWPFVFANLKETLEDYRKLRKIEDKSSIIGFNLGASWSLSYALLDKEHVSRATLVEPGTLSNLNVDKFAAKNTSFVHILHTHDSDKIEESTEFVNDCYDIGHFKVLLDKKYNSLEEVESKAMGLCMLT